MIATSIPFFVVDAFTRTPFEGNPAGVFFDDGGVLSAEEMRRYAGEVHLESAFVTPSPDHDVDFNVRYFTGVMEVPLCGHATVAAMTALRNSNRIKSNVVVTMATLAGVISASITDDGAVSLFQAFKATGPVFDTDQAADVAKALGLSPQAIAYTRLPVQMVSTGTPWLLVPVRSYPEVDDVRPNFDEIARISRESDTLGFYLFCRDAEALTPSQPRLSIWSRCFAPIAGLNEDPVTGSASGALGVYVIQNKLVDVGRDESVEVAVRQGFAGGRGGQVDIVAYRDTSGKAQGSSVIGTAVIIAEGSFTAR